ncbi:pyridoxamine 5'-phosphate oxidase family protein [Anaerocolumna sp. MB42-C2]|uniref:pyridoxamine 5'-phosphate oxidase family protein n=1 Tax=Anaerocolumna sp. MB42-C2 TaxID=3070997 RepID=UPI0027DEFCE3|nr:pyridoxamine 5'-phosphate oxidase family protein [Anaerocolumna sp. MB42-C2]WMJ90282.1 pyridoxamine 5'-phosphate oxidase family protein [Anaerocolumna sp. MB42-C2]
MDVNEELIQKAIEIIQGQCGEDGYCALTLMDIDDRPNTTTITPSKADGIKSIAFCTGFGTRTERIQFRPDACVCFNSTEYHISLKGRMEIITDRDVKHEMWYSGLANHFSGPNDPGYVVLRFTTDSYTLFIDWKTVRGVI